MMSITEGQVAVNYFICEDHVKPFVKFGYREDVMKVSLRGGEKTHHDIGNSGMIKLLSSCSSFELCRCPAVDVLHQLFDFGVKVCFGLDCSSSENVPKPG